MARIEDIIRWKTNRNNKFTDITGTIEITYKQKIDSDDPNPVDIAWTKSNIVKELKRVCAKLALNNVERADIYMHGYLDAQNGFSPNPDTVKKGDGNVS